MNTVKTFARLVSALGLAAVLGASAAFAQTPPPAGKSVKGYTKTMKSGKVVHVNGYTKMGKMPMPKTTHVKGYTKMTSTGKMVHVKGYNRMAPAKGMKPMPKTTM